MKRTARASTATLLAAVLIAACGGGEPAADTEGTTRSLLNQSDLVGGPSTPVTGDPDLAARGGNPVIPELGFNLGSMAAPLKLIEFSDYGCGYCRRFHMETFPTLREGFVDSGQVEWKFMPFITGMFENSLAVTEAAECTFEQGPALFEALSDLIWERQAEWKGSGEPEAVVRGWARELGADLDTLDGCLADDRRIQRIADATLVAQQLGVRGTPTFWLVGYGPLQGALPLEVFEGVLGAVLEQVEAARDSASADSVGVS